MSETAVLPRNVILAEWVEQAKADPVKYLERQITEILLHAIGITGALKDSLVLKGGILMSIVHGSFRQTGDVDFTAVVDPEPYAQLLKGTLDRALPRAAADLGYTDVACAVQRFDYRPRKEGFAEKEAPALQISIGYAKSGTTDAERLMAGRSTRILQLDISFKEKVLHTEQVTIEQPDVRIRAYAVEEIIAEKLRAILQQVERNRSRRQDMFDIRWLIERYLPDDEAKGLVLEAFLAKSEVRGIQPTIESLDSQEIKERSAREWVTMELEIGGKLPDFEETYRIVRDFYRSLPHTIRY